MREVETAIECLASVSSYVRLLLSGAFAHSYFLGQDTLVALGRLGDSPLSHLTRDFCNVNHMPEGVEMCSPLHFCEGLHS